LTGCNSSRHSTTEVSKNVKGYIIYIEDSLNIENIIFVPVKKLNKVFKMDDLEGKQGFDIKGYIPNELMEIKKRGQSFPIDIKLITEDKTESIKRYLITIVPAQLSYKTITNPKAEENSIHFFFKGKSYYISYVFNYDINVLDATILK
jgi:hypothetical protein